MRWQNVALIVSVIVVAFGVSTPAHAETPVCVIGHRECRTVVLLESAWGWKSRIAGENRDDDLYIAAEVGVLVNLDRERGVGLSGGYTTLTDSPDRFVLRGRYRHWLSKYKAGEATLGYIGGDGAHGVRTELAVEAADHIGLVFGVDVASTKFDGTVTEIGLAVRFGGFAGLPIALLAYMAAGIGSG